MKILSASKPSRAHEAMGEGNSSPINSSPAVKVADHVAERTAPIVEQFDTRIVIPVVGEYVIYQDDKGRKQLGKVTDTTPDSFTVVNEKGRDDPATTVSNEVPLSNLVLNVGRAPDGSIYGTKPNQYLYSQVSSMGKIKFFFDLPDNMKRNLLLVIDKVYETYRGMGIGFDPIEWTVLQPRKGFFEAEYNDPGDDRIDTLTIFSPNYSYANLLRLLHHELGHALYFNQLTSAEKARWVNLYHTTIKVSRASPDVIQRVRQAVLRYGEEYEPANDIEQQVFDDSITFITDKHKLDWSEINILIESDPSKLSELWPDYNAVSMQSAMITKYALTNTREFFAEAWSLFMTKSTLPDSVRQLCSANALSLRGRRPILPKGTVKQNDPSES